MIEQANDIIRQYLLHEFRNGAKDVRVDHLMFVYPNYPLEDDEHDGIWMYTDEYNIP